MQSLDWSALSARDAGSDVHAVLDASGTRNKRVEEASIARMVQAGMVPITSVTVGAEQLGHWQSETGVAHAKLMGDQLPFARNIMARFLKAKDR